MKILLFIMALGNFMAFYRDMKDHSMNVTYLLSSIVFFLLFIG